jgi:hypothetical protein
MEEEIIFASLMFDALLKLSINFHKVKTNNQPFKITFQNLRALASNFVPGVVRQLNLIDTENADSEFNHLDFVFGKNIPRFIINPVLDWFKSGM